MPYIKQEERDRLKFLANEIDHTVIETAGNLNYLITKLCQKFLLEGKPNYERHNSIMGVLESSKLEYYRRQVVEYENQKIIENGDV